MSILGRTLLVPPSNEILHANGDHILISPKKFDLNTQGELVDPQCATSKKTTAKPCEKFYQPLVMFVGGAKDSTYGPVLKRLFPDYNDFNESYQDIGYGTYKTTKALESLALHWLSKNQKIVLVGHSYGGNTVMNVAKALSKQGKSIELLVTLDPVSYDSGANQPKPSGVKRWLNVYVPYDNYRETTGDFMNSESGISPPKYQAKFANSVAMAGNPWEHCTYADANYQFFAKTANGDKRIPTGDEHARADKMFSFVQSYVRAVK